MSHNLAQVNLAHLRAPLGDPRLADFVRQLPEMNALADSAPGFLWRLTDNGRDDATGQRPFGDDVIVNLSLWESIEDLTNYVYRSRHLESLRRRREWFLPPSGPHLVLWWMPSGHLPTVEEAGRRLATLAGSGPSRDAFTLQKPYPAPVDVLQHRPNASQGAAEA